MKAMRAAIKQREAITPELLRVLESVAADPAEWARREPENKLPVLGIHLLAQCREKAAYPVLERDPSLPDSAQPSFKRAGKAQGASTVFVQTIASAGSFGVSRPLLARLGLFP